MRILVLGATGTVGSQVTAELVKGGHEVHALTRGGGKPVPEGARAVQGDLLDPQTVRTCFRDMDGLFLLNAVSTTEAHEGLMAVNGALEGRVRRIVYMSVHDVDRAPHLPHFGAKLGVEAAVMASGIPYTLLRPNNFFQNDHWYRDALLMGIYPQPLGQVGLSRVDTRDIAEAAAVALTSDVAEGETINRVGPEVVPGDSTAAVWSQALGREVRYAGDDLDGWEQQNLRYLPATLVYDFRRMYEHFQQQGLVAADADVERQTRLLGHPPRRFADFAREAASMWGVASAPTA